MKVDMTDGWVKSCKKSGKYKDTKNAGLYLNVTARTNKTGETRISKSWEMKVKVRDGKIRYPGLGKYPEVSLKEAREKAFEIRKQAQEGIDPVAEKQRAKIMTFREAAQKKFEMLRPTWRNEKTAQLWNDRLEKYAFPVIGDMRVDEIKREHILRILEPLFVEAKNETIKKTRQYIAQTLDYSYAKGEVEFNVARAIKGALPKLPARKKGYDKLPFDQVGECLKVIDAAKANRVSKAVFRFMVLTASRPGEARAARWRDIDLDAKVWTMKTTKTEEVEADFRQPLSDEAMEVLEKAKEFDDRSGLVFPSPKIPGKPIDVMVLNNILKRNGYKGRCVPHGFRKSFSTWANQKAKARYEVKETCLGHAVGSWIERSYDEAELLEEQAILMQKWADYLKQAKPAKVVPFARPA